MNDMKYKHIYRDYLHSHPRIVYLICTLLQYEHSPDEIYDYIKSFDESIAIDSFLIAKFIKASPQEIGCWSYFYP